MARVPWVTGPLCLGLALALIMASPAHAEPARAPTLEYPVKAAYLYQFARFTEWPAKPAGSCIGVLGDNPFGAALEKALQGKAVAGEALTVRSSRSLAELEGCGILFVASSETGTPLAATLRRATGWPALTVGESDGFTREGGMVRFFVEGNRVRFEVNLPAVERAGLRLSSRLLALARLTGQEARR